MTYVASVKRRIGTPDSLLTSGLEPIAKMSEPLRVPCSQKRQTAATIAQRMMLTEMRQHMRRTDPIEGGVGDRDGAPTGDEDEQPLQNRRHGQGHDQRRQTQIADAKAVHRSDRGGGEKREGDGAEARRVAVERHQRQNDRRDCDDRGDREIDAPADHRDGLANSDEPDHRRELDDVAQVSVGAEAADRERGGDPQDRDNYVGDERAAV